MSDHVISLETQFSICCVIAHICEINRVEIGTKWDEASTRNGEDSLGIDREDLLGIDEEDSLGTNGEDFSGIDGEESFWQQIQKTYQIRMKKLLGHERGEALRVQMERPLKH